MNIGFISAKGGVGVTVTASACAVIMAETQFVRLVVSEDTRAALGAAETATHVTEKLELIDDLFWTPQDGTLTIIDGAPGDVTLLVVRLCYLDLRRAVKLTSTPDAPKIDGIVVIAEPGRALTPDDAKRATGLPLVAVIPIDPTIARAVDAGLLATRIPAAMRRSIKDVISETAAII